MDFNVALIPQETDNTCWAAAMAMLLDYLSGHSRRPEASAQSPFSTRFTPRIVAEEVGGAVRWAYQQNRMLSTDFRTNFLELRRPWRLDGRFDFNNPSSSDEWERLLRRLGPIFLLDSRVYFDHALVVCGINQDVLSVMDPWPVGHGRFDHVLRSELRPTGTVIHSGPGTQVQQPSRGGGG